MFRPKYIITPDALNAISEIAGIKALVEKSRVLPLNEAQLRRQAIIRMTHTSTSIEGNKLAEFQVDKVLSGMSVIADPKSIQEVKNYQDALKEVEVLAAQSSPLTLEKILHLHSVLMHSLVEREKCGHLRPDTIYLVDDLGDGREVLRFEGPPAKKILYLLNGLLVWLAKSEKEELHPILRAGIFHVQFVTIHPFTDGNGRMARLLTNLILFKSGWDFRKILVLEDFYNRNRTNYYNALNFVQGDRYHEGEDLTPWLEYFIAGFLTEARKVAETITSIGFAPITDDNPQILLDHDEIKLVDFITTTGRLTSKDTEEVLSIPKRTAQFKLKRLVEKGLIKTQGNGPSTYYALK